MDDVYVHMDNIIFKKIFKRNYGVKKVVEKDGFQIFLSYDNGLVEDWGNFYRGSIINIY